MRISEIIESAKQKIYAKLKTTEVSLRAGWERIYDDNKSSLVESYQNLIYFQTYDVSQLLNVAKRKQNHRIFSLVPPKVKKSQITLNPIIRSDSSKMNKTNSVEMPSPSKRDKLESIIAVKMKKKKSKKVMTEKKIENDEKKPKEKERDKDKGKDRNKKMKDHNVAK